MIFCYMNTSLLSPIFISEAYFTNRSEQIQRHTAKHQAQFRESTRQGSQRLKAQPWRLCGSELDPLHMCCGGLLLDLGWTPNTGSGGFSETCLLMRLFPSYLVTLSKLNMRVCT